MKNLIATVFLIYLLFIPSFAQSPNTVSKDELTSIKKVIENVLLFGESSYSLTYFYRGLSKENDAKNTPLKPVEVRKLLEKDVIISSSEESKLANKYKGQINNLFKKLDLIGNSLGEFVRTVQSNTIPIRFATDDNKQIALFVTNIADTNVYNTLKTSNRQRALTMTTGKAFPTFKYMAEIFDTTEIKYFGVTIFYASQDFSDKYASPKSEYISVIVPSDKCKAFSKGDLTEDELLESAEIYTKDRDMVTGIKKIKLTIQ